MSDGPTMAAAVLEQHGGPLNMRHVARPTLGPGEVLVRIEASGVNPLDTKIQAGKAPHARQPPPAILGIDLAGSVAAVGQGVTSFRPGDVVYGMTGGVGDVPGSLAQYAAVDAELLAPKPASLSMREAAALPLVFITAWEGLVDKADVQAGHHVLVHGGAGGVGHIAIQIARARGAKVAATGSPCSQATIEMLGADFIDRTDAVAAYVARHTRDRGFDIVFDNVGGATLDELVPCRCAGRACCQRAWLGRAFAGAAVVQGRQLFGHLHLAAAADRRRSRASWGDHARGNAAG